MKGDRVGAGLGKGLDLALGLLDHQVDVERTAGCVNPICDRAGDQRPNRYRRHEVPVHHVDVDHPGAGAEDFVYLSPEPGEVGREDRRRNSGRGDQLAQPLAHTGLSIESPHI